jgi:hypothetical protein
MRVASSPGNITNPGETDVQDPSALIGTLIGRWTTGPWFVVGSSSTLSVPTGVATLQFACNDRRGFDGDNSGELKVTVGVTR